MIGNIEQIVRAWGIKWKPENPPIFLERIHKWDSLTAPIFYRIHFQDLSTLDLDPADNNWKQTMEAHNAKIHSVSNS